MTIQLFVNCNEFNVRRLSQFSATSIFDSCRRNFSGLVSGGAAFGCGYIKPEENGRENLSLLIIIQLFFLKNTTVRKEERRLLSKQMR